jgi:hypothetical protein
MRRSCVTPLTGRSGTCVASHAPRPCAAKEPTMGLILLIVLLILLLGGLPRWSYSRNWGYGPSGVLGVLLVVVLILLLLGYLPGGF